MANSKRRYIDNNGNQFMPMAMEGSQWNDNFMSTKKLVFLGIVIVSFVLVILSIKNSNNSIINSFMKLLIWFLIAQYIVRFIIFEERFYYKMYKILKDNEITTPAIFWNIASISNTQDGAILTYSDSRVAIILKMERDTIIGKTKDFREDHYDAISDFYKEIMRMKYKFIQFNIMEKAGNDPRLERLDPLIHKSDNTNIQNLMEKEIGYIKAITHNTLYESDYIMIYTNDISKVDSIISDAIDCMSKLLDGAYIGYHVLTSDDITEFVQELYGVKFFDYTQAMLDKYKLDGTIVKNPFTIYGLEYTDGTMQELDKDQINKIYRITSGILNKTIKANDVSFKEALYKKDNKFNNFDIDLDKIEHGEFGDMSENDKKKSEIRQPKKSKIPFKTKNKQFEKQEFSMKDFEATKDSEDSKDTDDDFDDDEDILGI